MNMLNFAATVTSELDLPKVPANAGTVNIIIDIVFAIIGTISVLVIVIAGFQIIVSAGEPAKIAKARQSILYAVVGLIVAISAFVIISFVVSKA